MKYFKNAEVAKLYNVSEKAVRNWLDASRSGRMNLELYEKDGRTFIADTLDNELLLATFTDRAKKYRNGQSHRKVEPSSQFYDLYTKKQVLDIISSLDTLHEIPHQYRYIGPGGVYWTSYLHKLYASVRKNALTYTIDLLRQDQQYISDLIKEFDIVNVVDLGAGNGLAARGLLKYLLELGKLQKYIAVDISPQLLSIASHNIKTWFDNKIVVETHIKDLASDSLRDVIFENSFTHNGRRVINIVLILGGIHPNFRNMAQPLNLIRESMGKDDVLISTCKPDSAASQRFFDFSTQTDEALAPYMRQIPDLIGITSDCYDVEQLYDANISARLVRLKLKVDITINFKLGDREKAVTIEKGERIILWRFWHNTIEGNIQVFTDNGFTPLQSLSTPDQEFMIMITKVKPAVRPKIARN